MPEPSAPSRKYFLTWALIILAITIATLLSGSVDAAKTLAVSGAIPFSLVLLLQLAALLRTLRARDMPAAVDDTARDSLGAIGALWVGEIDIYVDYTGSILALSGHPPVHEDPTSFVAAEEALAPFELSIGPLLGFSNDDVVLARLGSRAAAAPARLSALADAGQALRMGC